MFVKHMRMHGTVYPIDNNLLCASQPASTVQYLSILYLRDSRQMSGHVWQSLLIPIKMVQKCQAALATHCNMFYNGQGDKSVVTRNENHQ